jgi:CCR4-NOT transcription complex subunit 1
MLLVLPPQNISIKPIIMHAMAEWYIRGDNDQTKLSRILDVAQDLKVSSSQSLAN